MDLASRGFTSLANFSDAACTSLPSGTEDATPWGPIRTLLLTVVPRAGRVTVEIHTYTYGVRGVR